MFLFLFPTKDRSSSQTESLTNLFPIRLSEYLVFFWRVTFGILVCRMSISGRKGVLRFSLSSESISIEVCITATLLIPCVAKEIFQLFV